MTTPEPSARDTLIARPPLRSLAQDLHERRVASVDDARRFLGTPRREPVTRREMLTHPIESSEEAR